MLPRETLKSIEKSFLEACAFRAESARGNVDEGIYLPVKSVEIDVTKAIARGNCERATNSDTFYPEFERSRDRFNQIRQAVIENREVDLTLFKNDSKNG